MSATIDASPGFDQEEVQAAMGEDGSAEETDTAQEIARLHRRITSLESRVAGFRDDAVWLYATLGVRVVALAVIVMMSMVWLAALGGRPDRLYDSHSALGLITSGAVEDDMRVSRIALAVCLVAAIALAAGAGGRWVSRIAAVLGLLGTLVALTGKPGPLRRETDWDYAWHAPASVTVVLWLIATVLTMVLHQSQRSR